jgi:hypothetical protein
VPRRVGCLRLRSYSTAWTAKRRPRPAAWTVRPCGDWVHRYNAAGLTGLRNLKSPGAGSKLTARQQAELAKLVEAGPDPAVHGVVRWRRVVTSGVNFT